MNEAQRNECPSLAPRAAKERKRLASDPEPRPPELPELRRRVIVIDYDFGRVVHRIDLYRTNRADCYRAVADGRPWRARIGWARVLWGMVTGPDFGCVNWEPKEA